MIPSTPWLNFAQEAVNLVLRLDPETRRELGALHGKRLRLALARGVGAPLEMDVLPSEAGFELLPPGDAEPDVRISGTPALFARVLAADTMPRAAGELVIRGDLELGNRFRAILERVDPDWEEPLAHILGDVAAHEIGRAVRAFAGWGRESARTLALDAVEYLQEESRLLPRRERVEAFLSAVDILRTDADRMQRRIEMLEARLP